jgi:mannan endo-1,4-beta-mannosidase
MRTTSHRLQTRRSIILGLVTALLALSGCTLGVRSIESIPTIDRSASDETKALFMKLWTLADSNQTLFGHQDDLFFGVGWRDAPERSDVKAVAGSFPAVYGWEIGALELGGPNSGDGVPFDTMRENIIEGYRRGGVITISWHMANPVTWALIGTDPSNNTLGTAFDRTPAVSTILPGGSNHAMYRSWLDAFAQFDRSLTVSGVPWNPSEHLVPIIFRPFHEHNGSVFWWGGRNTTEAEYIALWRFTVGYLRDTAGLHNLLYAYSPDVRFMSGRSSDYSFPDLGTFETAYDYAYPGDAYVDVLGLDFYQNMFPVRRGVDDALVGLVGFQSSLDMLVETSHHRSDLKIPALTETGGQRWDLPNSETWWTKYLYPALVGTRSSGGQVAYVLTWRNWDATDHSGPYLHSSDAADFVDFAARPMIHLEDEIPFTLYTWP